VNELLKSLVQTTFCPYMSNVLKSQMQDGPTYDVKLFAEQPPMLAQGSEPSATTEETDDLDLFHDFFAEDDTIKESIPVGFVALQVLRRVLQSFELFKIDPFINLAGSRFVWGRSVVTSLLYTNMPDHDRSYRNLPSLKKEMLPFWV
jgi:hypothetical protein